MKTWCTINAIAIEQRERRIAEFGGAIDERFWERGALEKAEGGGGVEFDVRRRHVDNSPPQRARWTRRLYCRSPIVRSPIDLSSGSSVSSVAHRFQSTIASINH